MSFTLRKLLEKNPSILEIALPCFFPYPYEFGVGRAAEAWAERH